MNPQQIAQSALLAAWLGAVASTIASIVALGIAIFGARQDEYRRRRLAHDQETAFCWAMVGAFEMIKPIIIQARNDPQAAFPRRTFGSMLDHAHAIAHAGLASTVFDMRLLHDAYQLRGALNLLKVLPDDFPDAIPSSAVLDVLNPSLERLIDADDRFYARLPSPSAIDEIAQRTSLKGLSPIVDSGEARS